MKIALPKNSDAHHNYLHKHTKQICSEFESHSVEVYSIQNYVIKLVSDLRQVGGFLQILQFLPQIKFAHHNYLHKHTKQILAYTYYTSV
jgi:hypothetical protein